MGGRGASYPGDNKKQTSQSWISKGREYINNLRSFEHSIRSNDYETLGVMDKATGKLLWSKPGGKSSVSFTPKEAADMKGRDVTHNHPSGLRFSPQDLKALVNTQARSIRAAGKRGTYILRESKGKAKRDPQNFSKAYTRANNKALKKWRDAIVNGKRQRSRDRRLNFLNLAIDREMRKWLKERAKDYGYIFKFDRKHK